ncbi:MAG: DUF4442 domain-containing protein [Endozoicomonadaceae bacterium]|nr:DUF4442 domain-containing protein [Endozoicomonadaceae bacterium]
MAGNRLSRMVANTHKAPAFMRPWLLTKIFGATIKFAGTANVQIHHLSHKESSLTIQNRKRVQNHIGSVHACAMALLAESATGYIVGMNVPDDSIPVIKSMHIDYVKRATGDLHAVALLTNEQIQQMHTTKKGEVTVGVTITDDKGVEPIKAEMIWAWTPKHR